MAAKKIVVNSMLDISADPDIVSKLDGSRCMTCKKGRLRLSEGGTYICDNCGMCVNF